MIIVKYLDPSDCKRLYKFNTPPCACRGTCVLVLVNSFVSRSVAVVQLSRFPSKCNIGSLKYIINCAISLFLVILNPYMTKVIKIYIDWIHKTPSSMLNNLVHRCLNNNGECKKNGVFKNNKKISWTASQSTYTETDTCKLFHDLNKSSFYTYSPPSSVLSSAVASDTNSRDTNNVHALQITFVSSNTIPIKTQLTIMIWCFVIVNSVQQKTQAKYGNRWKHYHYNEVK